MRLPLEEEEETMSQRVGEARSGEGDPRGVVSKAGKPPVKSNRAEEDEGDLTQII